MRDRVPTSWVEPIEEDEKREFLSFSSYWRLVIFGIRNRTGIRRDCVGSPVFGVFPVKAESRYRKNRQILPKSRESGITLTGGFREQYARAQAHASWALAPDLKKPDIGAGFRHQVRKPVRVSWAPAGLLTFVSIGAGFRDQYALARARPSWAPVGVLRLVEVPADAAAKVFPGSHRACAWWGFGPDGSRKPAQTRSRIDGTPSPSDAIGASAIRFPRQVRGRGLASWGAARWNAYERLAAARRELGLRGRRW